jgi:hypothetical protein
MNEQIQQLAEQAFADANNGTMSDIKIPKEFVKKFALLIVRECIDICMKKYDTGLLMAPQSPWIANQIKEHFGVE